MPRVKTQPKGAIKRRKPSIKKKVTAGTKAGGKGATPGWGMGGGRIKAAAGKKKGFGVKVKKG